MKIHSTLTLFWVLIITWMSVKAYAHPTKESLTLITYNPRSEAIEIAHRFGLHDAEYFTRAVLGRKTDLLTDKQSQIYFAAYVHEHFSIRAKHSKEYKLEDVGVQVDGNYLWVYQELPLSTMASHQALLGSGVNAVSPEVVQIKSHTLRDIWPKQRNVVNIDFDVKTHALVFEGDVEWQDYDFDLLKKLD